LRLLYRNDLRELDALHEIVDALKKKDGQSLGVPTMDGRSMILQKMGAKKDDR
jgi:hypothetical protein